MTIAQLIHESLPRVWVDDNAIGKACSKAKEGRLSKTSLIRTRPWTKLDTGELDWLFGEKRDRTENEQVRQEKAKRSQE